MIYRQPQHGAAMIEILVSMLIVAFGTLGFVGLQARTTVTTIEGYQRSQALILVNDIAQRINLNRSNAAAYVANDIGIADPGDCSTKAIGAPRDLCEWALLIQGSAEQSQAGLKLGAVTGARGCITSPSANRYLISIAWQGVQATGASPNTCGQNAYSDERMRRTVTSVVQLGLLAL